ncbi:hypothetical protein ACIPK7_04875 [Pseudomonas sp. NPDC086581]|uniref:hypothetical protein n=1 Tax=Pseudomonas sp. NPDC086581 TaxID=3364432 RepID=UPI0037F32C35
MPGYDIIKELNFLLTEKKKDQPREILVNKQQLENDRHDYGIIYDLLENRDAFITAINELSKELWTNYRIITNQVTRFYQPIHCPPGNLFTRALGMTARACNFTFQQGLSADTDFNSVPIGVKLTGGDPYIGYLIRRKLFWKDSISADHGEHSHSIQWLAIARRLNGQTISPIDDLYSRVVDYWTMKKTDNINLWQFLVDCFPLDGGGARDPDTRLVTNSFRSPNNITRHLISYPRFQPRENHFISNYLCMRYANRNWATAVNQNTPTAKVKFANIKVDDSTQTDWKRSEFATARLIRKQISDDNRFSDRTLHEVVFHDTPGYLYMTSP